MLAFVNRGHHSISRMSADCSNQIQHKKNDQDQADDPYTSRGAPGGVSVITAASGQENQKQDQQK
jgi:hypothetical protein